MVTSRLGDGVGEVPRVDEGEVVRSVSETDRVLIEERGEGDRVRRREEGRDETSVTEDRGESGVVGLVVTISAGELGLERVVTGLEGEDDKGVREANVEAGARGEILEGDGLSLLDLVDEDIARGITHLDTLIVVDNSVVSIGLNIGEGRR